VMNEYEGKLMNSDTSLVHHSDLNLGL